jgi:HEAT repeat protein
MTKPGSIDENIRQQNIAENIKASKPILSALLYVGFNVESISDLYNKHFDYRRAIPLLLNWLPKVENPAVKEEIVRALSVPWAKGTDAPKLLVAEFPNQISNPGLQWAIGNALSVVADDEILNDIIGLIQEKQYGKAREMLVIALGNMKTPDVETFLIGLLNDQDLVGYAIMALGKIKSKNARPLIESFTHHPKAWIRKEAIKAIKRIDKSY